MKTISDLRDLRPFGIDILTGEADALSYRLLCDLNKRGCDIICEALGLTDTAFHSNYNSGNGACASMMLTNDIVPIIAPIALIKDGAHTVFSTIKPYKRDDVVVGFSTLIHGLYGDDEKFIQATGHVVEEPSWQWIEDTPAKIQFNPDDIREFKHCSWGFGTIGRFYRHGSGPHVGTRNVHAMSGRVV